MPRDVFVFDVPVYRVAPEAWEADALKRVRAKEVALAVQLFDGREPAEEERARTSTWARYAEYPYGWRYNEVVGSVRLLSDGPGPVVKGYLWRVGKKTFGGWKPLARYQRGFKPFPFFGGEAYKVLEVWASDGDKDEEIYDRLRGQLVAVVLPEGELPRRHIDLSVFDVIGPLVRWRQLLGLDQRYAGEG